MKEVALNDILLLREKFKEIEPYLNERSLRIWCATEADTYNKTFGFGGYTVVHRATGISYPTIRAGLSELREKKDISRIRQKGSGRKKITDRYPNILHDLELVVEPLSRGDPESALRWTCKSVRNLAEELQAKNYSVSFRTICDLLEEPMTLKPFLINQNTCEPVPHVISNTVGLPLGGQTMATSLVLLYLRVAFLSATIESLGTLARRLRTIVWELLLFQLI